MHTVEKFFWLQGASLFIVQTFAIIGQNMKEKKQKQKESKRSVKSVDACSQLYIKNKSHVQISAKVCTTTINEKKKECKPIYYFIELKTHSDQKRFKKRQRKKLKRCTE